MSDLWAGSSDIFTDYEGTITDARFEEGQYGTQMVLTFDEIDGRENGTKEFYSVDKHWETQDGGETIERVDGETTKTGGPKPMRRDSQWQRFVMAAAACEGARDELGDEAPITASAWIGTRWHMSAVEGKKYKDDEGKTQQGRAKNYPDAFLGKDTVVTSTASGSTNGQSQVDSLSVLTDLHNPSLEAQIAELAPTVTYNEWFQKSYAMLTTAGVNVSDHPDLLTAMSNPVLYEKLGGKG